MNSPKLLHPKAKALSMKRPVLALFFSALLAIPSWGWAPGTAQSPVRIPTLLGYPERKGDLMAGRKTVWSVRKIGRKEFFYHPGEWASSASAYIMMMRKLTGKDVSFAEAAQRMGVSPGNGASNDRVVEVMRSLGGGYEVVTGSSSANPKDRELSWRVRAAEKGREMKILRRLLRSGYLVMINFREPVGGGGHYGVLQGISPKALEIADPNYGLRSIIPLDQFDFRSGSSDLVLHGWYVAVRPRQGPKPRKR